MSPFNYVVCFNIIFSLNEKGREHREKAEKGSGDSNSIYMLYSKILS